MRTISVRENPESPSTEWDLIVYDEGEQPMPLEEIMDGLEAWDLFTTVFYTEDDEGNDINMPGSLAFHYTEKRIWQQWHDDKLTTKVCTLDFAERHAPKIAKDFHYWKKDYRRRVGGDLYVPVPRSRKPIPMPKVYTPKL